MAELVLDLTRLLPGPLAGRMLRELGFDVLRLLPPAGDLTATASPEAYAWLNDGKRHETVDLKTEAGRGRLCELVPQATILIETNRAGVMERLGVGPEVLREINPKLTYVRIGGYRDPKFRELPGHDLAYLAADGLLDRLLPAARHAQLADVTGAYWAVIAALQGTRQGGGFFEVYLAETARPFAYPHLPGLDGSVACYAIYPAARGRVVLAALEPHLWARFCQVLGKENWANAAFSPTNRTNPIYLEICATFAEKPSDEWDQWAIDNMIPLRAVQKNRRPETILPWMSV